MRTTGTRSPPSPTFRRGSGRRRARRERDGARDRRGRWWTSSTLDARRAAQRHRRPHDASASRRCTPRTPASLERRDASAREGCTDSTWSRPVISKIRRAVVSGRTRELAVRLAHPPEQADDGAEHGGVEERTAARSSTTAEPPRPRGLLDRRPERRCFEPRRVERVELARAASPPRRAPPPRSDGVVHRWKRQSKGALRLRAPWGHPIGPGPPRLF